MREFVQSQKAGSWHVIGMSTEAGSNSTRACTTPGGEAPRSTESCGMGRSGRSQVRWVVSWPPPWVPVPMNVVTALPTSEPLLPQRAGRVPECLELGGGGSRTCSQRCEIGFSEGEGPNV